MKIKSPVTGKEHTSLIRDIRVADIVDLYRHELQMEVGAYFTGLESIELRICDDTGYRFYYPLNIFGDDKFYQDLQRFAGYYAEEKWEYRVAAGLIETNKRVLEIGSGGGYFLEKLSGKACTVLCGLELNTSAVETSVKKGLHVINATIEGFAQANPESFDVVVALQVFEHISDIRSFLNGCLQALKPGGKLILCVPHNNPYLYKQDFFHTLNLPPHHAGLWNKQAFANLPGFFPLRLNSVHIEPLTNYKKWYQAQVGYLKTKGNPAWRLLSVVPRSLYKVVLKIFRHFIEGRNILVEFVKI